ncbi:CDP-abequose synthase [Geomonas silvestris]|uniref:CDP-abequose synthase n=1 Tax=Geomonas silvestris TaxID=2740184 RepID=A0A6V8MLL3_9BACT|nr:NAD(P)-dependent oxidoreductase [Geomonas silvestris]GFO60910.1 CDP-abequose synthase [Geomonas silvestris]
MTTLVTGATGFVGGALTRRLVELGREVHILTRAQSDTWRLAEIEDRVVRHVVDLSDAATLERVVAEVKPQIVYHLATYGGFASQRDTDAIFAANLTGTMNLLRACEKVGFDCFVNTGSSSEYGTKKEPMREADIPEPLGDYGVSKVAASLHCRSEALQKGLPVVTLRLFSPYGPWDDPKRFIPYLLATLLRGETPRLSTPLSVRDWVYIDDVLDLYLKTDELAKLRGEIINVGSGSQSSLGEVAALAERLAGTGASAVWGGVAAQRVEPTCWVADIGKAKALLDWEPQTGLTEGLEKTVDWMRGHLSLYR